MRAPATPFTRRWMPPGSWLALRKSASTPFDYAPLPSTGAAICAVPTWAGASTPTPAGGSMERIGAPAGIVFVIADGLSAAAVNAHAVSLLTVLLARFRDALPAVGPVAVVEGGRVAIGDEIGALLGADLAAVLIGERPGLSAADSLGVYVTWQPAPGTVDAARNCISNVRPQGLPIADAAEALFRLVSGAYCHRLTGVALSRRLADEAVATRPLPAGLNRG